MIMIDKDSCVNCGVCSSICPTDAIVDNCGTITIDMDICIECGACIAGCPTKAISSVGVVTGNTESAHESQHVSGQIDEYRQSGRNKTKDALAWTILHGGTAAAKFAILTVAVAAGFLDRAAANNINKVSSKILPHQKEKAWKVYTETGSIAEMFTTMLEG